jgi:hypothetical protein
MVDIGWGKQLCGQTVCQFFLQIVKAFGAFGLWLLAIGY